MLDAAARSLGDVAEVSHGEAGHDPISGRGTFQTCADVSDAGWIRGRDLVFGTIEKDGVILTVVYDAAGRVQKVYRDRW